MHQQRFEGKITQFWLKEQGTTWLAWTWSRISHPCHIHGSRSVGLMAGSSKLQTKCNLPGIVALRVNTRQVGLDMHKSEAAPRPVPSECVVSWLRTREIQNAHQYFAAFVTNGHIAAAPIFCLQLQVSIVHGHLFVELLGFSQRHRTPFAFGRANWERKGKKEKNKNKIRWNTSKSLRLSHRKSKVFYEMSWMKRSAFTRNRSLLEILLSTHTEILLSTHGHVCQRPCGDVRHEVWNMMKTSQVTISHVLVCNIHTMCLTTVLHNETACSWSRT